LDSGLRRLAWPNRASCTSKLSARSQVSWGAWWARKEILALVDRVFPTLSSSARRSTKGDLDRVRIATALFDWVSFGSRRPHAFDEGEAPLTRAQERGFVRASKATVRGGCCSGCGVAHSCNSQQSRCRPKGAPGNCFPYEKAIGIREADAPVAFWNRRALQGRRSTRVCDDSLTRG
jgi:hypothetical protein